LLSHSSFIAGTKAFKDAGIKFENVEQACVGYVYGDSTCGQRAVYGVHVHLFFSFAWLFVTIVNRFNHSIFSFQYLLFLKYYYCKIVGLGLTGIPIYNVNNNCSTGSTALFMAYNFVVCYQFIVLNYY
jgi:sterol carrier protein 2